MYFPKPGIKKDPVRRWNQTDRVFFGHGACHILAGVYLQRFPDSGFYAVRIIPGEGLTGNHAFVTDGTRAFDYHGYSFLDQLIAHHTKGWQQRIPDWQATISNVDFPLLDTAALNAHKMLGPDQYLHNPVERAQKFIDRFNHERVK